MQAQAKVPRGRESGPTCQEGEQSLRPQRRANTVSAEMASHMKQVVGDEQPSPSRMGEGQWVPTKATGQCSWDLLRHIGGGIRGMIDDPKQRRSRWQSAWRTSLTARRQELSRLADQVVVARTPRDSTTLAERRTCGVAACPPQRGSTRHAFGPTGRSDRVVGAGTKGASNPPDGPVGKVAPDVSVRSRHLQAVLGKTRRTEFQ